MKNLKININKQKPKVIFITNKNKHWKPILDVFKNKNTFKIILNKRFGKKGFIICYFRFDLYSWSSIHCDSKYNCEKHGVISTSESLDVLYRYFKYHKISSILIKEKL